jgi:uracil-DNA glycosylase
LAEAVTLFPEDLAASQLQTADPADWPVAPGWQLQVDAFFQSPAGIGLQAYLRQRLQAGAVVFPPQPLRALELTPPDAVRLVILGQDPYHGRGQAEGLAFSVALGVPLPPSLRNIFKELHRDLGRPLSPAPISGGSLTAWATSGALLLNTCLTVEEGQAHSHRGKGWEIFTDTVISRVSQGSQRVVFMLWGAPAQTKRVLVDETRHLVLCANHPSPLSALRAPTPFLGCSHFSQAQAWLQEQGQRPLTW